MAVNVETEVVPLDSIKLDLVKYWQGAMTLEHLDSISGERVLELRDITKAMEDETHKSSIFKY